MQTVSNHIENLSTDWRIWSICTALLAFGSSIVRELATPGRPTIGADAAFFQHAGWYVTQGAVPYVDFWDIKPPMTHITTTVLAYVSGGNMELLHWLSVSLMALSGVAVVYLVGVLTYSVTRDDWASYAASLSVLSLAGFHYLVSQGFYPKYPAIALGLTGILLQRKGKSTTAGFVAALAAGYIQHAAVFFLIVLGLAVQRWTLTEVRNTIGGMVAAVIVVVTPIVLLGGTESMITETIVVLVTTSEPSGAFSVLRRIGKGMILTGYAGIPVLIGVYGISKFGLDNIEETWWIIAGGLLYGIQIFAFDFDSYPDLFFGLVFISIGTGLVVSSLNGRARRVVVTTLLVVVAMSVGALGGVGIVTNESVYTDSLDDSLAKSDTILHNTVKSVESYFGAESMRRDSVKDEVEYLADRESVSNLYWGKKIPKSCHYRLSIMEVRWIEQTGRQYESDRCGRKAR